MKQQKGICMKIFSIMAGAVALAVAAIAPLAPAYAVGLTFYTGQLGVLTPGEQVICNGVGDCGGRLSGDYLNTTFATPGINSAYPDGSNAPAITVLGGKMATLHVGKRLTSFGWDQLSNDSYNWVDLMWGDGSVSRIDGFLFPPTNGDQSSAATNFRINAIFDPGDSRVLTSATFGGAQNSNEWSMFSAAGAVPEPASWAMLIVGFGLIGSTMRRRAANDNGLRSVAA
jgi:hypothetical protein